MKVTAIIPILRIFDEAAAREFYLEFLEFEVDWEHRYEPDLPLYMQVSRADCTLHLSGHHGDACPGASILLRAEGVAAFQQHLLAKQYKHCRPGLERAGHNTLDLCVQDPFGNRLTFSEPLPPA